MKLAVIAIGKNWGKTLDGPEHALWQHYAARLPWPLELKTGESRNRNDAARKEEENALLLKMAEGYERLIALDETGQQMSSMEFSGQLTRYRDTGVKSLAFLIGGSDGLTQATRQKADRLLSFGRATWPHLLVRGMLAEQLYRAYTIHTGHPYHREG
jgi:23S rRNA (pseudouridine1915-N3)-methyltransferase